jgi:hypothetical protein
MEKPEVKGPVGIPRRGLWDDIKMDVEEIGWGAVYWIWVSIEKRYGLLLTR